MLNFQSADDSARQAETPEIRKARLDYWRDEVLMEALFRAEGASAHTKESYARALEAVRKDDAEQGG